MKRTHLALTTALVLIAGTVGGIVSHWAFRPAGADAQANPVTPEVATRRLRVVDNQNRTRMALATLDDSNGAPGLVLTDLAGKIRTLINVSEDGQPFISMYDRDGKERSTFTVLVDGRPQFNRWAADEKLRASLRLLPDGGAGFAVYDTNGMVRGILGVDRDGIPAVTLLDADGRPLGPGQSAETLALADAFDALSLDGVGGASLKGALALLSATNP